MDVSRLLACSAITLLVAGCGVDGPSEPTVEPATPAEAPAPAADVDGVVLPAPPVTALAVDPASGIAL